MRKLTDNAKTLSGLGQWYPMTLATATTSAQTSTYTAVASDMGKIFTNAGASGTVSITLPSAALVPNQPVRFACLAAQVFRAVPISTERIYLNGSGVLAKYAEIAGVIGNFLDLYSDGTDWHATYYSGVVTKQA